MDHMQFCAEYANETASGRIVFSKRVVYNFINTYTYFTPDYFTSEMIKRLRMVMIDYYNQGVYLARIIKEDLDAEKIELPKFVFE